MRWARFRLLKYWRNRPDQYFPVRPLGRIFIQKVLERFLEQNRAERMALAEKQRDGETTGERELLLLTSECGNDQTEDAHSPLQLTVPEEQEAQQQQLFAEGVVPYPAAQHSSAPLDNLNPDKFFEADYTAVLQDLIKEIVQAEGPLPVSRLARAVAHRHGWQRTGRRIAGRVDGCLDQITCLDEFGVPFAWSNDTYRDRVPYRGLGSRAIRNISRTEIAWAIDQAKSSNFDAEDPVLEMARHLGIGRLSKDARAFLENCIAWREETRNL